MKKTRVVGLNPYLKQFAKRLIKDYVDEQTILLVDYAKEKVLEIGEEIKTYHSKHGMDRTGNLLNSLCWGVSYDGKLKKFGFYRKETLRDNGIANNSTSFLHEWFSGDEKYLYPINGHELADQYVHKYGNNGTKGFRVFFAILAPYWGYWEKGFNMKSGFSGGTVFKQFAVMTQFYDEVKSDLKPARTRIRVSVPKYSHAKIKKRWEKKMNSAYK